MECVGALKKYVLHEGSWSQTQRVMRRNMSVSDNGKLPWMAEAPTS